MVVKDAVIRAVRSGAQAFVALVVVTGVPAFSSVDEVKAKGIAWGFAAVAAGFVAVLSFVQNFAETNSNVVASAKVPRA